jgi:hypothetical protein
MGAHAMLGLRSIQLRGLWDEFMRFYIDRDCRRLYPHSAANDSHMKSPLVAYRARAAGCTRAKSQQGRQTRDRGVRFADAPLCGALAASEW